MKELKINNKAAYFRENYPFENPPKLTYVMRCIHCEKVITVGDFKVFQDNSGMEYICCPNAPACNGTVIDWIPVKE